MVMMAAFPKQKSVIEPQMFAIRKVYVTGHNLGQVDWAYKNFPDGKGSCAKPVTTPEEADAILQVEPAFTEDDRPGGYQLPIWVNCTTHGGYTHCIDSSGYSMDTSCTTGRNGQVNCTSTYGPDLGTAVLHALGEAVRRSIVDVYLYDKSGKKLLWSRKGDTTLAHGWAGDFSEAIGCVQQRCPVTHFKPCDTHWYEPSQLGPNGKLLKRTEKGQE